MDVFTISSAAQIATRDDSMTAFGVDTVTIKSCYFYGAGSQINRHFIIVLGKA